MTKQQHPIVPPPELVQQWCLLPLSQEEVLVIAAQWGADQELEACVEWLEDPVLNVNTYLLCADRRPKPPSVKEQALARLALLEQLVADMEKIGLVPFHEKDDSIRLALEALPDA